jgi:hypothetical protein
MEYCRTVSEPEEESSSSSDAEVSSSRSRAIASSAICCDWAKPSICDATSFAKSLTECSAGMLGGAIAYGCKVQVKIQWATQWITDFLMREEEKKGLKIGLHASQRVGND